MKITKLETFHVKPRWLFLKISTDEGIAGYGEPVVEGRARTVETAIHEMDAFLTGKDPLQIEFLWQSIYRNTYYRGGPVLTSALSGIEQALWDIKGKYYGLPVYEMLGGVYRTKIRMYSHCWGATTEKIIHRALERKSEGFTAIKILLEPMMSQVGQMQYIAGQIERFAQIREALGPEMDIAIDFHGRLASEIAIQIINGIEPYRPMFVEEPCLPENIEALCKISRKTNVPIAAGERVFTRWGFQKMINEMVVDVFQPDLCHAGGIFETRKIAAMAEVNFAKVAPHNPLGPISLSANLQIAVSTPNFLIQEHFGMPDQWDLGQGYLKTPYVVKDGYIFIEGKEPGLGIEIDQDVVLERIYPGDWDSPRLYNDEDGSIVDW